MGVTEYIGARYVPIFQGYWREDMSYDALDVVMFQGDSYTARKPVPAGVSVDNAEYWIQSGNYDAQTEAYRRETKQVKQQLDGIKSAADRETEQRMNADEVLGERITANGVSITALGDRLTTERSEVDEALEAETGTRVQQYEQLSAQVGTNTAGLQALNVAVGKMHKGFNMVAAGHVEKHLTGLTPTAMLEEITGAINAAVWQNFQPGHAFTAPVCLVSGCAYVESEEGDKAYLPLMVEKVTRTESGLVNGWLCRAGQLEQQGGEVIIYGQQMNLYEPIKLDLECNVVVFDNVEVSE